MIPPFTHSGVLPPFLGDAPGHSASHAPYRADLVSIVDRFGTNIARLDILDGLLAYREQLATLDLLEGFQWIDGSFVEDCEMRRGRVPGDIDIVTFIRRPEALRPDALWVSYMERHQAVFDALFIPSNAKAQYRCDAYLVEMDVDITSVIEQTHFWFGMFSHSRDGHEWKGILQIPLYDAAQDADARTLLAARRAKCSSS